MPEDGGTAHISGYLHASSKTSETTVKGWLFDARKNSGITSWTPVDPGQNGDWRQQRRWWPTIQALDARHAPRVRAALETAQKDSDAGKSGTGRYRGQQRNPLATVEDDTPEQAAVLPILSKMQVNQLLQLCRTINVDCDSHIHKEDLLPKFMGDHDAVFSAYSHLQADAAATFAAAATMTLLLWRTFLLWRVADHDVNEK